MTRMTRIPKFLKVLEYGPPVAVKSNARAISRNGDGFGDDGFADDGDRLRGARQRPSAHTACKFHIAREGGSSQPTSVGEVFAHLRVDLMLQFVRW